MLKSVRSLFLLPVAYYLRFFAKLQLRKINPVIVGVGGASGKTSVALLISEILEKKFKVKQGKGKNSETGIPLSILDIDMHSYSVFDWIRVLIIAPVNLFTNFKKYDFYVVEMGIDGPNPPKNMEYLLSIVKPGVGVLTNINIEHSVYFDPLVESENDLDRKKRILDITSKQEGLLLKSIDQSGRCVVNLDDSSIKALLPLKSKTITLSAKEKNADFYITSINIGVDIFEVKFVFLNNSYQLKLGRPLPKYYAYSFILAISTCFACGISIDESINVLEKNFTLPPGRFSVFKGIKNSTIFDSSYNSSLEPATGALETVSEIAGNRRRVAILGDMRELGSLSRIQHELLAKTVLKKVDLAILIGSMMNEFVAPILRTENFKFQTFLTFKDAKKTILETIQKDDLILIKGSQNTLFLERAVEMLLADKSDTKFLCRRERHWDKVRREA